MTEQQVEQELIKNLTDLKYTHRQDIEYYQLFKEVQAKRMVADANYTPLNIACAFSPPAEGNKDVQQIQEDLPHAEKIDVTIVVGMLLTGFDGDQLSDLLAPLGLGWKARTQKELALMESLAPVLRKLAKGREISGLGAYE